METLMTASNWLIATAAVSAFIFAVMTAALGVTIRTSIRLAHAEFDIAAIKLDVAKQSADTVKAMENLYSMMRDDRFATNERLRDLEKERRQS
jgi:hypothetical protein